VRNEDVSREDVATATTLVSALAEIPPQFADAIQLGLTDGLLDHGRMLVEVLIAAAERDPLRFSRLREQLNELQLRWLAGESLSDRADEDDLRAQYALWAAERVPGAARLAANAVLGLPEDHPLRDVAAVREALLDQLGRAIRPEADQGDRFRDSVQRADFALTAIGALLKHELVSPSRLASLFEAGAFLLQTPGVQPDHPFALNALPYVRARWIEADKAGDQVETERWQAEGRKLLGPVMEAETDPGRKLTLTVAASLFGDQTVDLADTLDEMVTVLPEAVAGSGNTLDAKRALFFRLMSAQRQFAAGQVSEAAALLAPVLPSFTERYLSAVVEAEVSEYGSRHAQACELLALAYARLEDWKQAVVLIDQCKSLRFRYQAALRSAVGGDRVIDLEAALYAHERGIDTLPPDLGEAVGGVQPSPQSRLLEAYRQVRVELGSEYMQSPGIAEIAGLLGEDEAVAVLGLCSKPAGVLLAVIVAGDEGVPSGATVLAPAEAQKLVRAFVAPGSGWLIALNLPGIGIEPRASLGHLIETADAVIGVPLRRLLVGRAVRRLTVIPHGLLHLVPYWALPSLAELTVAVTPSGAQFVGQRSQRPAVSPTSLVVGNPTGDLDFAGLEAGRVAERLRSGGFATTRLDTRQATESGVSQGLNSASVLHFSGHGLSEMFRPLLSGLEVRPDATSLGEQGADPLPGLAATAAWEPMRDNERRAKLPDGRCLYERVYPISRRIELRLESGTRGTLRGRYVWTDDEECPYGRCLRLAELLTVGDLLQEEALRDCRLAFLSACSAGLGGLSPDVDEFAGLPAALQLAGVEIVVSPLWPVDEVAAALFADLFYAELASTSGEVDVAALVGDVRSQLRRMNAQEAADHIEGLGVGAETLLARTLVAARAVKVREGPELPFEHPFDWAAFHAVGPPVAVVGERPGAVAPKGRTPATRRSAPSRDAGGDVPLATVEPEAAPPGEGDEAARPRDVADAWDLLARNTTDPVIHQAAAEALFERGNRLLGTGDVNAAVASFERALELQPRLALAHVGLGHALGGASKLDAAIAEYTSAITVDPDCAAAYQARGDAYLDLDRLPEAIADYNRLVALAPASTAYSRRALAHQRRGDHDLAIADFSCVIAELPEQTLAYSLRSESYAAQGKFSLAVADLDTAVFLRPQDHDVVHDRGFLRMAAGRLDLAIADYEAALALDPGYGPAYYNRACARSLLEEGRRWPPLALLRRPAVAAITADLRRAVELDPELAASARTDPDLSWARRKVRAVRRLVGD
jgi:tetratricopeptide (TPR) repeat protein/CHAT domain-containing protein